jgi:hypothetical protein
VSTRPGLGSSRSTLGPPRLGVSRHAPFDVSRHVRHRQHVSLLPLSNSESPILSSCHLSTGRPDGNLIERVKTASIASVVGQNPDRLDEVREELRKVYYVCPRRSSYLAGKVETAGPLLLGQTLPKHCKLTSESVLTLDVPVDGSGSLCSDDPCHGQLHEMRVNVSL